MLNSKCDLQLGNSLAHRTWVVLHMSCVRRAIKNDNVQLSIRIHLHNDVSV